MLNLQGTSADQDTRFSDKEKKLLKQMKFSESLNAKVFPLILCLIVIKFKILNNC